MERCRDVLLFMRTCRPLMRPELPPYLRTKAAETRELPFAATLMFLVRCVLLLRLMIMLVRVWLVVTTDRRNVLRLPLALRTPMSIGRLTLLLTASTLVCPLEPYLIVDMWLPGPEMTFALALFIAFLVHAMFLVSGDLLTTEMAIRALPDGLNILKNLLTCLTGAQC